MLRQRWCAGCYVSYKTSLQIDEHKKYVELDIDALKQISRPWTPRWWSCQWWLHISQQLGIIPFGKFEEEIKGFQVNVVPFPQCINTIAIPIDRNHNGCFCKLTGACIGPSWLLVPPSFLLQISQKPNLFPLSLNLIAWLLVSYISSRFKGTGMISLPFWRLPNKYCTLRRMEIKSYVWIWFDGIGSLSTTIHILPMTPLTWESSILFDWHWFKVEEKEDYLDIPQCSQWKAKLTWGVVASSSGSTFPLETDDACFVKYVLSGRCRSTQAGAKDVVWRVDSPSMAGRIAWIARIGPQPHSNPPYCVFWPIWTMSKNEEHFLLDIAIAQKRQQLVLLILGNKPIIAKCFLTSFW